MTSSKSASSRRITILNRPAPTRSASDSVVQDGVADGSERASLKSTPSFTLRSQKSASLLRRPLSIFLPSLMNSPTETSPKIEKGSPIPAARRDIPPHPTTAPPGIPNTLRKPSPHFNVSSTPDLLKPLPPDGSPSPSPQASPALTGRGRHDSLVPPPSFADLGVPGTNNQRPSTADGLSPDRGGATLREPTGRESHRLSKARSWLPGRSRNASKDLGREAAPRAWINAGEHKIDYNHVLLCESEMVPELWDENADTYVYLFPKACNKAPSFKISSALLASSPSLVALTHGGQIFSSQASDGQNKPQDHRSVSLPIRPSTPNTPPYTPSIPAEANSISDGSMSAAESLASLDPPARDNHLYFPINLSSEGIMGELTDEDVESLIQVRNLFAFLTGQPLVSTKLHPNYFTVFLAISTLLKKFEFSNFDGSTFGEAAVTSFNFYNAEFSLQDVTKSPEKTIEALVLGERMRSIELYTEAFAHAAGKYNQILAAKSPFFDFISANTRNRLERAAMDLQSRILGANDRLTDFEFPSMWSGAANSTSSDDSKLVSFKDWRSHFQSFRKHILGYYKHQYGAWPPKASSKKNNFAEDGMNRIVLKQLYHDFSQLYDYLVDRKSETTRTMEDDGSAAGVDPVAHIIRRMLGEFDRSSPPVAPPIPFDVPLIPSVATIDPGIELKKPKDIQKAAKKSLKEYQTTLVLTKACNLDADIDTYFLAAYKEYEARESKHKSVNELVSLRIGVWLFLYAVIQSLPMLVVDAPGLKYTHNVEYFLCEIPRGQPPWVEDAQGGGGVKMAWYEVSGGAGVVALPSDVVEYGVEGIYRRSHCWEVAKVWAAALDEIDSALDLPVAPGFGGADSERPSTSGSGSQQSRGRSRNNSLSADLAPGRSRSSARLSSFALGLEQLPMPAGFGPNNEFLPRTASPLGARGASHSRNASLSTPSNLGPGPSNMGGTDRPVSSYVSKGPSTFDAILGDMEGAAGEKDKKKKKSKK